MLSAKIAKHAQLEVYKGGSHGMCTTEKEKVNAEIALTQAQGQANSNLARARAEAEATRLKGEAEATAIKARAQALAQNQDLVELTKAERWDGKLPTTMIPNSAVPFLTR